MQAYRLVIGPDGTVKIPDGEPGRRVTVLLEESSLPVRTESVVRFDAMNDRERELLRRDFLERGRLVRARLADQAAIDHDSELYGADGLPK